MRDASRAAQARARAALAASMCIFGTVGLLRRALPLPSGRIALVRAAVGLACLLAWPAVRKQPLGLAAARPQLPALCLSGAMMGLNWILLFEAYRYASVAVATLCYYMAPVFVALAAPLLLRERLTRRSALCAAVAALGVALVSGVFGGGDAAYGTPRGVLYALLAAALYACVVLVNKRVPGVPAGARTAVQLFAAAVVLLPYTLLVEGGAAQALTPRTALLLLTAGVLHTGIAYTLYFSAMEPLGATTVALMSYLDPVVAVLLSALVLGEPLGAAACAGAALILGAACVSELPPRAGGKTA